MMLPGDGPSEYAPTADEHERAQRLAIVGEYALGIAHDFNNVLMVVLANASVLEMQYASDSETPDELRDIVSSAQRGNEMIQRLIRYVRQEPLSVPLIHADGVIASLSRQVRALMPRNITLDVQCAVVPFLIRAEVSQIEEIVLNLATNARDAMPEGGTLQLKVSVAEHEFDPAVTTGAHSGPFVTIEVTDTGCGLDDATRHRMFEPFFSTKRAGKGLGLGLSMTRSLIHQLNGHIDVRTESGIGTTVSVMLPVVLANAT
ncbi:MAG: ATP-binding protein [Gemmatimonadaceae bacterium]